MPYQIHVKVGTDIEKELKAYADHYGISIADTVRIMLTEGLKAQKGKAP